MISGDFMTELELLFYVSWSCLFMSSYMNREGNDAYGNLPILFGVFVLGTLLFGVFHQILKTICFRIPWYDWFFG